MEVTVAFVNGEIVGIQEAGAVQIRREVVSTVAVGPGVVRQKSEALAEAMLHGGEHGVIGGSGSIVEHAYVAVVLTLGWIELIEQAVLVSHAGFAGSIDSGI